MITPEEGARKNLANNIFSGVNKPKTGLKGPAKSSEGPKKDQIKTESLI